MSDHLDSSIHSKTLPLSDGKEAADSLLYYLKRVLQSKKDLPLDESFVIDATVIRVPPLQPPLFGGFEGVLEPDLESSNRFLLFAPRFKGSLKMHAC